MEKIWLICRKNKISGPFDEDQVREMLENKTLSLQDEVIQPLKQWVYIRNTFFNPSFDASPSQKVVSDNQASSQDIENTVFVNLKDDDSFSDVEIEGTGEDGGEFLPNHQTESDANLDQGLELEQKDDLSAIEDLEKDVDVDQAVSVVYAAQNDENVGSNKTSHAEFGSIEQIKRTANDQSLKYLRLAWTIIGLSFVVVAGVYMWQSVVLEKRKQDRFLKDTLTEARYFFSKGEYEKSLNLFKKVPVTQSQDRLSFSSLLLKLEGDSYRAEANLENISDDHSNLEDQMRELVLQGMIEYQNGNYQLAQDYLQRAQKISSSQLATINNVTLHIQMGQKEQALEILNKISLNKQNKNFILFLKAYLSIDSKEEDVNEILQTVMEQRRDYAQESSLLSLYRDVVIMKKDNAIPLIRKLLDQDPYLTQEHFYDILSYNPRQVWKDFLLDLCNEVVKKSEGQSSFIALHSLCLAQSGLLISAQSNIEKALNQSPKDSLIQALYGYILLQNNQVDHSQIPVSQSVKNNLGDRYIFPFILHARWCEQMGQFKCAEKNWNKVKENKLYFLSSLGGLLRVYSRLGLKEKSSLLLQEGLRIAPHYKTFLSHKSL